MCTSTCCRFRGRVGLGSSLLAPPPFLLPDGRFASSLRLGPWARCCCCWALLSPFSMRAPCLAVPVFAPGDHQPAASRRRDTTRSLLLLPRARYRVRAAAGRRGHGWGGRTHHDLGWSYAWRGCAIFKSRRLQSTFLQTRARARLSRLPASSTAARPMMHAAVNNHLPCLLYTSPSPRD